MILQCPIIQNLSKLKIVLQKFCYKSIYMETNKFNLTIMFDRNLPSVEIVQGLPGLPAEILENRPSIMRKSTASYLLQCSSRRIIYFLAANASDRLFIMSNKRCQFACHKNTTLFKVNSCFLISKGSQNVYQQRNTA